MTLTLSFGKFLHLFDQHYVISITYMTIIFSCCDLSKSNDKFNKYFKINLTGFYRFMFFIFNNSFNFNYYYYIILYLKSDLKWLECEKLY